MLCREGLCHLLVDLLLSALEALVAIEDEVTFLELGLAIYSPPIRNWYILHKIRLQYYMQCVNIIFVCTYCVCFKCYKQKAHALVLLIDPISQRKQVISLTLKL